jgi:hypothetical protein
MLKAFSLERVAVIRVVRPTAAAAKVEKANLDVDDPEKNNH